MLIACSLQFTYTSKKKGYFKIDFPERKYASFDKEEFPYSFEYPVYAQCGTGQYLLRQQPENPYWINIDFPQFRRQDIFKL